jgi:PAS domain S-box-containing protein
MPTPSSRPVEISTSAVDRALVSAFLANVPDSIYFKDRDSRFIAVSTSHVRHFGMATVSEVIGKTDFDFFSPDHAKRAFEDEQRVMRTGESIVGKLEKEVWPDGRESWMLTSKMPLRGELGEIIGTFGLSKDVTASKQMEEALEKANKDIMDASRMAGMAEVATGVLHNVGNVLNSLNVSATVIAAGIRQSKSDALVKVCSLLDEHTADLGAFLTQDPRGQLVPQFLHSLCRHSVEERARLLQEIDSLQKNIDHIKEIVCMQQTYAKMAGMVESLDPVTLMEDSLRMNASALVRHDVSLVRDFQPAPAVLAERGKVLQILVNLIRNAKYALDEGRAGDKVLTLRVEPGPGQTVRFVVIDNGVGIPPENLTRIFAHGFTTRRHGHGFGLHSSALAARELHGSLSARSSGAGKGAEFTLELPAAITAAASHLFAAVA